jgi:hypothetical protein
MESLTIYNIKLLEKYLNKVIYIDCIGEIKHLSTNLIDLFVTSQSYDNIKYYLGF